MWTILDEAFILLCISWATAWLLSINSWSLLSPLTLCSSWSPCCHAPATHTAFLSFSGAPMHEPIGTSFPHRCSIAEDEVIGPAGDQRNGHMLLLLPLLLGVSAAVGCPVACSVGDGCEQEGCALPGLLSSPSARKTSSMISIGSCFLRRPFGSQNMKRQENIAR
jgi:hypothetical protein